MRSLELGFGALRLFIAVFTVLLIVTEWTMQQALKGSEVVWVIAALFCVYSLLIHEYVTRHPETKVRVYAMSAIIDMAYITYLALISGGPGSIFYPLYIVLTALHAYYFGMVFGLAVGGLASLLYLLTYINLTYPDVLRIPDGMKGLEVVFRLILPLTTAFFCGVLKAREQLLRTRLEDSQAELYWRTRGIAQATSTLQQRIMSFYLWGQATGEAKKVPNWAEAAEDVIEAVLRISQLDRFAVFVVDSEGAALNLAVSRGLPKSTLSAAQPSMSSRLVAQVFQKGTPQLFRSGATEASDLYGPIGEEVAGPMLIIPMLFGTRPVGLVTFHRAVGQDFAANEIDFFAQVAAQLGSMLAARLYPEETPEACDLAETLGEAFVRAVEDELARPRKPEGPMSVALVALASRAPQEALSRQDQDRLVARGLGILEREMREGDRVLRCDEAILGAILPRTPESNAQRLIQRLNSRLRAGLRTDPSVVEVGLVVWGGIATFPQDGSDGRTLVQRAREALAAARVGEIVCTYGEVRLS